MTRHTLRIMLHALPLRPHRLTDAETGKVFGGCVGLGEACSQTKDCCTIEQNGQTVQPSCKRDANPIYQFDRCLT
jgi:hypothetical protein